MKIDLFYQLTLRDRHGRVLIVYPRMPAHSWLQAYVQCLRALFNQSDMPNVRDTSNSLETIRNPNTGSTQPFRVTFPAGNPAGGIQIGTGATPVTMTDFEMDAFILQGNGAGQMEYALCTVGAFVQAGDDAELTIARLVTNNSGGQIVVAETGIAVLWINSTGAGKDFLIVRDVLPATIPVDDAQSITVEYTIQVSI